MAKGLPLPPYAGAVTSCHAQALALAEPRLAALHVAWLDILSTVPAGIVVRRARPMRLLDCVLDPDLALDRALELLGVRHELRFCQRGEDQDGTLALLGDWLAQGPVMLGPLSMGRLPYLPNAQLLYEGMDHYLVARGLQDGLVLVDDPEGYFELPVRYEALLPALRAQDLPEGRGGFTMRRIIGIEGNLVQSWRDCLPEVVRLCAANLRLAAACPDGGPAAIRTLATDLPKLSRLGESRAKLLYGLERRVEKCLLLSMLLSEAGLETSRTAKAISLLNRQSRLLSETFAIIWKQGEFSTWATARLAAFADAEERLSSTWQHLAIL